MKAPTIQRSIALPAVFCYVLSYLVVLALAVAKGLDVLNTYRLIAWLLSALVLFLLTGIVAGIVFLCLRFRRLPQRFMFVAWVCAIVIFGVGLVLNAQ